MLYRWKQIVLNALIAVLGIVFCYEITLNFLNGDFSNRCDLKLTSNNSLRIVRDGPYTVGQFAGQSVACDLQVLKTRFHQPPHVLNRVRSGGGYCTMSCPELIQQKDQQILIGNSLYSSNGGFSFTDPQQLTHDLPKTKDLFCQRFSLLSSILIVQYWRDCSETDKKPQISFVSSDSGRSWQIESRKN